MDMRVDQAGQHVQAGCVDDLISGGVPWYAQVDAKGFEAYKKQKAKDEAKKKAEEEKKKTEEAPKTEAPAAIAAD